MSADDADPDDAGLDSLRSMFRSLPDEEPPARGLDALMAAARVKAEVMAQPSMWERFVAMLRAPQVLALATIMILIGGAVFISQRRDKLEAAQPTSAEDQMMQERAGEQAPAAVTATPAPSAGSSAPAADPAAEGVAGGSPMVGRADTGVDLEAARPAVTALPSEPKKPVTKKSAPGGAKTTSKPKMEKQSKSAATSGALSIDELDDSTDKATEKAALADDAPAPTVKQLHTQARAAAARKDCTSVKALAKKIAAQDAPYYRANIAPDTALAACLN